MFVHFGIIIPIWVHSDTQNRFTFKSHTVLSSPIQNTLCTTFIVKTLDLTCALYNLLASFVTSTSPPSYVTYKIASSTSAISRLYFLFKFKGNVRLSINTVDGFQTIPVSLPTAAPLSSAPFLPPQIQIPTVLSVPVRFLICMLKK